jgi:hypothetical protein
MPASNGTGKRKNSSRLFTSKIRWEQLKSQPAEDNRRKVKALPWIGECPPDAQEDIKDFGVGVFCVHPEVFCTQSPRISQSTKNGCGKIGRDRGLHAESVQQP